MLDIVEEQVYYRLTEEPAPQDCGHIDDVPSANRAIGDSAATPAPIDHPRPLTGENCIVIFTNVVKFGSPERDDGDRLIIRRELMKMTSAALNAIWDQCFWDDRGDGLLIVVPPTVATVKVLEYLLVALPIALKQHNGSSGPGTRIQLRVALDVGPVTSDDAGVSAR